MTSQVFVHSNKGIPDSHNFLYKNKKFPFKIDFFKYESSFFKDHLEEMQKMKDIELIDEEEQGYIEFTEYSIQSFINYVHSKEIPLDNENVIALNYLSNKYGIPNLFEETEKYIYDHHSELILPILLVHRQDQSFNTTKYEQIISDHLKDYLEDAGLSKLPIPILHRIIFEYRKINYGDEKYINFLFKCLDEHGRMASVLFKNFDFSGNRIQHLLRLQKDYKSVFDFNFISSAIAQALIENQKEHEDQTNSMQKEHENQTNSMQKEHENQTNSMQKEHENQIKSMQKEHENQIKSMQKEHEDQIKSMQKEIEKLKSPLVPMPEDTYFFIKSQECNLFLDVERSSKDINARIIVSRLHGGHSQKWRKSGTAIINVNSNLALDIRGSESVGQDLIQHPHNGGSNQQWSWCNGTIRSPRGYCIEIKNSSSIIAANNSGESKQKWTLYY